MTEPSFDDTEATVSLDDGESFVGLFDPKRPVPKRPGLKGGTVYSFSFTPKDSTLGPVVIEGGKTLLRALKAVVPPGKVTLVKLTAHGKQGTTDRTWDAEAVE